MRLRILFREYASVALSLCVLAFGIVSALYAYSSFSTAAVSGRVSFEQLRLCLADRDNVVVCGREEVQKLLRGRGGKEVMSFLAEALPAGQCHTIGHLVGQEVYKRNGNIEMSIAECGYGCTGSCVHGVIGEALIQELGLIAGNVDPQHLDVAYVESAGKRLCEKRSTCHAVGHILFQIYNEFDQPLSICEKISDGEEREHCFRGVFMEHADTVSTHNLLLGTERKQLRDPSNLRFPCDGVAPLHQHACLRYLPRIQEPLLEEKKLSAAEIRESEREVCESFSALGARTACFEGYGFSYYGLVRSNTGEAHRVCDGLSITSDRVACTLGLIYPVADFGDISLSLSFCSEIGGREEKNMCYHAVFEAAQLRVSPRLSFEQMRSLCVSALPECDAQLGEFSKNPWDTAFGVRLPIID